MGQGLALLICGTAISSQYLASDYHVNTPMLQSLLNYALLCITYTPMLFFRTGRPPTPERRMVPKYRAGVHPHTL
jgi:solute carrier family 35 protein F1/2